MNISEIVAGIKKDGYSIVGGVIPADAVDDIRRGVVAAQPAHHEEAEARHLPTLIIRWDGRTEK